MSNFKTKQEKNLWFIVIQKYLRRIGVCKWLAKPEKEWGESTAIKLCVLKKAV